MEEAKAALGLLAKLLKAEPVLGLELAQMVVPGHASVDLPTMLTAVINVLCAHPQPAPSLIGEALHDALKPALL